MKALAADLDAAQQTLSPLQRTATTATKAWRRTLAKLAVARAAQARADEAAAAATAAKDAQDEAIGQIAASAYKAGGDVPTWMTALNVNNPTDLFTQQATLNEIAAHQATQLRQFEQLQTLADAAALTAQFAAARVFTLVDQARRAHDAASAAMGAQQKVVHDLITRQAHISDAVQSLLASTPAPQRAVLLRDLSDALTAVDTTAADVDASMRAVDGTAAGGERAPRCQSLGVGEEAAGPAYSWGGGTEAGPTRGTVNPEGNSAGLTTTGFDCSGLTLFAWAKEGFALDHYTGFQWFEGRPVSRADLRPGDLVFYATDPKIRRPSITSASMQATARWSMRRTRERRFATTRCSRASTSARCVPSWSGPLLTSLHQRAEQRQPDLARGVVAGEHVATHQHHDPEEKPTAMGSAYE